MAIVIKIYGMIIFNFHILTNQSTGRLSEANSG
jgi:hypothetical protein